MRLIVTNVLMAGILAGCVAPERTSKVDLHTDGRGRLHHAVLVETSGNKQVDADAKQAAINAFRWKVPNPRKNTVYHQTVRTRMPEEFF
jgi:hypothetical protein